MIPDIDLVLQHGTLGGRFTTLEGILDQVYEELSQKMFMTGDSSAIGGEDRIKFQTFLEDLNAVESRDHQRVPRYIHTIRPDQAGRARIYYYYR